MFFKRREYKKVLNAILNLSIAEESNYEDLTKFYDNLVDFLNNYYDSLSQLPKYLSNKEKNQLSMKLIDLIRKYSKNIKQANENILTFLQSNEVPEATKTELALYGKNAIKISSLTIEILEKIAVTVL